jgi:transposase-like protein
MELSNQFVHPSAFCWYPQCVDYGKVQQEDNIRRFGRTQADTQRYKCKTCRQTFVETIGTVFYGRHHSQQTILECLALLGKRNSLAAIQACVERTKLECSADEWATGAQNIVLL